MGDQAEGGLYIPHLCIDPAQDGNKERMASDNSRLWLQISAIRPDTKHAHQFYRVVVCAWIRKRVSVVHQKFTQSKSRGVGL